MQTYPARSADIETTLVPPVPGDGNAEDGHEVDECPEAGYGGVQDAVRRLPIPHDDKIGVDGNGTGEATRGQVAGRDEPALGPAHRDAHHYRIRSHPPGTEHERRRLVQVGQQQVEDEHEELVRRSPSRRRYLLLPR